tara:strand:- start:96669 stop:97337 length:669 start_codon:yes stop_codon:yes gene_type:complete
LENLSIILNVIIIVCLVIGFFLIKNLIPSYFSEKGKNLATKEDIEEITTKVKTVESQINILTGNILEYSTLKRQYIIDYFAAYNNWERTITSANLDYSTSCAELNRTAIERIYNAKHSYNLKEGEIELFIEDRDFYNIRKELTIKTLKYQHEFEKVAYEIESLFLEKGENGAHYEDLKKVLAEYREYSVSELKEIYKERNKLTSKLTEYIKQMMEKTNDSNI